MGILYASGHVLPHLTKADGVAVIMKPYRPTDILKAVSIVKQITDTGKGSLPFPERFKILNGSPNTDFTSSRLQVAPENERRLMRQQAALAQFGSFAFSATEVQTVLTEAARVCAEGLGVTFCKICRYRPDENDLLVEAGVGWIAGLVGQVVSQADDSSPQGRAFMTKKPVICVNLAKEPTFVPPSFYADHKIVSTVDVVIPGPAGPYGILEIDNPAEHVYDEYDINFLTGFANIIAGAVESAKRKTSNAATISEKDRLLTVQRALLNDKALLARELNHRVRNNLQFISGMLEREIKDYGTHDNKGVRGFEAISRRIIALSRVYDHLLGTGLSQKIEFSAYLSSLCADLLAIEIAQHPAVRISYDLAPAMLDLDTVSSLGLIVTELISNSFEHAFPNGEGAICLSVAPAQVGEAHTVTVTVGDNGVGFSSKVDSKRNGLGLVKRLAEQMGGTATHRSDNGTEWSVTVPARIATP
jgi:two-component sensor histidine kinase